MRAPFFRPLQGVVKQMNSLARIESHPLAGGLPRSNSWGEGGGGKEGGGIFEWYLISMNLGRILRMSGLIIKFCAVLISEFPLARRRICRKFIARFYTRVAIIGVNAIRDVFIACQLARALIFYALYLSARLSRVT